MGAGELRVRGGAAKMMEARFLYNRLRMRPEVSAIIDRRISRTFGGGRAARHSHGGTIITMWDLAFNNDKPLDLEVNCGAGKSQLDLGDLSLRRVNVEMGVGELRLDLRGAPKSDYMVSIRRRCRPGDRLSSVGNVGIEAEARGGIGGIHATGWNARRPVCQRCSGTREDHDSVGHPRAASGRFGLLRTEICTG